MIEDDGKGFDVNAYKEGYGLQNLDARTRLMKGTMDIDSQPGKGTSVYIEIPYS
jgi:two-component system, NarL family, sensor kinase